MALIAILLMLFKKTDKATTNKQKKKTANALTKAAQKAIL